MFITITGNLGSGKSTICKLLCEWHGFVVYSTGSIHRSLAGQMGIGTLQLNELMRGDIKYDRMIDGEVGRIARERAGERIIFDSRLAWHFVPKSFKIFTVVDPDVAARRVRAADRGAVEAYASDEDAKSKLQERARAENARFKEIYGINNLDFANFDLIIDTTQRTPQELAELVYAQYEAYCANPWTSPRRE